jgi:hypothetical protein
MRDEMKTVICLVLFAVFVICVPAYSHTFKAIDIGGGDSEALLRDTATGDEWLVQVGDKIDIYRVIRITEDFVTIGHMGDDGIFNTTNIPIGGARHTVKTSP